MKYLSALLILIYMTFIVSGVYAQTSSNQVLFQVGEPKDPKPNIQTVPGGGAAGASGLSFSCPLGDSYTVTCGTLNDPTSYCGHGGLGYAKICNANIYVCAGGGRYSEALYYSIDVRPTGGTRNVYLPSINGQSVEWELDPYYINAGPTAIAGGSWGWKVKYTTTFQEHAIVMDLTHIANRRPPATARSGDHITETHPGFDTDGGTHLHTAINVDNKFVEPRKDLGMCAG